MIKLSVKKPFTVLVAVIMIIALGVVALTSMTADLLPEFSLPYMMVITTYPGAGPEKVESMVTKPMESALGTISGVKNLSSTSSENFSMVQLEFEDDTDMGAALVKVSNAIDSVKSYLPAEAGTPNIMEISMDMMATDYLGVSYTGKDLFELSDFVEDELVPYIERQDGVADVTTVGLVEKSIQVDLDEELVQDLNDKILASANKAFADAYKQIKDAKQKLLDGQKEIDDGWDGIEDGRKEIKDKWNDYYDGVKDFEKAKSDLQDNIDNLNSLQGNMGTLLDNQDTMMSGLALAIQARNDADTAKNLLDARLAYYSGSEYTGKANNDVTSDPAILAVMSANPLTGALISQTHILPVYPIITQGSIIRVADPDTIEAQAGMPGAVNTLLLAAHVATGTDLTNARNFLHDESAANTAVIMSMVSCGAVQLPNTTDPAIIGASVAAVMNNTTYSQAYTNIAAAKAKTVSGIKTILDSYNQLREGAGLGTVNLETSPVLSPAAITAAGIKLINEQFPALWASSNSYIRSSSTLLEMQKVSLDANQSQLDAAKTQLENAEKSLDDGADKLRDAQKQIDDGWKQYNDSVKQFDKQREQALLKANADDLVSLNTLSSLIYAQNFEMPAGYIDDKEDNSWLLKVGENFDSADSLENIVLCKIKDVGEVKLSDIAKINLIDTTGESYAKLNGEDGILLAVFKGSTASTNEVSKRIRTAMDNLESRFNGLSVVTLMDQGEYIDILVSSVLESMIIGAVLAVIILAIFLKDVKPTIVVAISIPLSVLLAIVCMYFSKITLNIMTLAGLALGIGMLVDNSIVVIENIYRLRALGYSPAQAAVTGAKQVAGPIISSTLTTVCVFLPILFATGMVKDLILPMCLTVTFCLSASLIIALTVVPASGSTLLKNSVEKKHTVFDSAMDAYGKALEWCLSRKAVALLVAIMLLAVSVWQVMRMGIVMIPDMATEPIAVTVEMPENMTREEAYKKADEVLDAILKVENVETVGAMPSSAMTSLVSSASSGNNGFRNYLFYVMMSQESPSAKEIRTVTQGIEENTKNITDCEISMSSSSLDMSALTGDGLAINIYGNNLDTLLDVADDVMDIIDTVEGYSNIRNGQEDGDGVLHLLIDKNKAMSCGLSVAQIYQELSTRLTKEKTSTTLEVSGQEMDVIIRNNMHPLNAENILDYEIETNEVDKDGDNVTVVHKLSDFASIVKEDGLSSVNRKNLARYITVSASVDEGYNATLLSRDLKPLLEKYEAPDGYRIELGGESDTVNDMIIQMSKMLALGFLFIYLVMVAQFQSLLSPFIILFTIPLAFTGGLFGLLIINEQLSIMALMGFMILMGTVVNNGIVFVDYTNQLRIEGKERHEALIETGKQRMRPILMTALTTILAMAKMVIGSDMASQMGRGMAIVIMGGLTYATFMTLFIVPVIYDILFKKAPLAVNVE